VSASRKVFKIITDFAKSVMILGGWRFRSFALPAASVDAATRFMPLSAAENCFLVGVRLYVIIRTHPRE
jgi:hypothetical protein